MTQESNELIREVTSSLRNEKIKEFYLKNSKRILIGLAVVVVFVLVLVGQSIYQKKQNEKYSINIQKSITSQQNGKISESREDLERVFYNKSAPANLKAIAGFRLVAVYLSDNSEDNTKKIISIYKEINECKKCDEYSRDLSGMLWGKFSISNDKETLYEEMIEKLKKAENSSKHFKYEMAIDRAFYELEQGHLDKSTEVFEFVSTSLEAAPGTKETAKQGLRIVEQKRAK